MGQEALPHRGALCGGRADPGGAGRGSADACASSVARHAGADDAFQHPPGFNLIAQTLTAPLYSGVVSGVHLWRLVWPNRQTVSAFACSFTA